MTGLFVTVCIQKLLICKDVLPGKTYMSTNTGHKIDVERQLETLFAPFTSSTDRISTMFQDQLKVILHVH